MRYGSDFWGKWFVQIRRYVGFFPLGNVFEWMKWIVLVHLLLLFLCPCVRHAIYLEHPYSQITLYFSLSSWQYFSSFTVSALRMALFFYIGLMVGSTDLLVSLFTRCWIFGGNRTGVDTKLTDSRFSQSLMVGQGVRWLRLWFEGETVGRDEGWGVGQGNGGLTGVGFFGISGCFDVFGIFVALLFSRKICLLLAVISINPAVVIGGTPGRSAGVFIFIIGTLGRLLWVDSAHFVTLEDISLSFTSALRVWVSGGGSNGFRCDWQRAEVISFAVARRISVALAVWIGIL